MTDWTVQSVIFCLNTAQTLPRRFPKSNLHIVHQKPHFRGQNTQIRLSIHGKVRFHGQVKRMIEKGWHQ